MRYFLRSKRGKTLPLLAGFSACLICLSTFLIVFLSIRHSAQAANSHPSLAKTPLAIEQSILDNMMVNGFNNHQGVEAGLWINWQYGTAPLQVNFQTDGVTDSQAGAPLRHDPFTDLRYVHSLWLYKSQNPQDTTYDGELQKYTPIVKAEFSGSTDQRGWLYNQEFMDLYNLSHDDFYKITAIGLVANYAKSIDPKVGIWYKISSTHLQGYYRPEDALEEGLALIQAGTQFNIPEWVRIGQTAVNFVYSHAYMPLYHTFAYEMDQVLTSDGSVNPSETFYIDNFRNYVTYGNIMRVESIAQIATSLLQTFQITQNHDYLQKAAVLLNPLSIHDNSLGMWDDRYFGYFDYGTFSGSTPQQPGNFVVDTAKKEAGRQMLMLCAFTLANRFNNNRFQDVENKLLNIGLTKAYYAPGHGVLYEMTSQWQPLIVHSGPKFGMIENWVTTEAMGIELEALFEATS